MKPGRASRTAEFVCIGRAAADGRLAVGRFSDPVANWLLSAEGRARVERFRSGWRPRTLRGWVWYRQMERRAQIMAARTVAIDDAVRGKPADQVIILGAGLDGRAWRMPELKDTVVFEVDHPDSQREKRDRVSSLTTVAREVRFVPVDFTRDRLEDALASAGHNPSRPTIWIWEGVVMYLTPPEIEACLAVIQKRSAPESRLVIAYHTHAPMLVVIAAVVRFLGEPLRSSSNPQAMAELLARFGFKVVRDEDIPTIAAGIDVQLHSGTRAARHLRIVTADRVSS